MRIRIKITDKSAFKSRVDKTDFYISLDKATLKDAITQLRALLFDTNSDELKINTLFDSFLIILNGTKVVSKDEYDTLILKDEDTIIIAPLVAGG